MPSYPVRLNVIRRCIQINYKFETFQIRTTANLNYREFFNYNLSFPNGQTKKNSTFLKAVTVEK